MPPITEDIGPRKLYYRILWIFFECQARNVPQYPGLYCPLKLVKSWYCIYKAHCSHPSLSSSSVFNTISVFSYQNPVLQKYCLYKNTFSLSENCLSRKLIKTSIFYDFCVDPPTRYKESEIIKSLAAKCFQQNCKA